MPRTVTRLLPDKLIFISKIESWLNDMAKKGLRLKHMRPKYAVFEKAEPGDTKYCIAELKSYPSDAEMKKYSEAFWGITCRVNYFFSPDYIKRGHKLFVFESTDSYEKHPTKEIFGKRRGLLTRYTEQKIKYIYFLLVALAAFVAAYFNISKHYILFLPSVLLSLGVLFLLLGGISYLDKIRINRLEKQSKDLGRLEHKNWKEFVGVHKRRMFFKTVCWILIFGSMLYIVQAFTDMITRSDLDEYEDFVRLEDIESYDGNLGITYGTYAPSVFVPAFYIAEEEGYITDDEGRRISVGYDIVYNKCNIQSVVAVANGNCVLMRLIDERHNNKIIFTGTSYFPQVAYVSGDFADGMHGVKMCLSNDKEMIYIRYRGDKTAPELIEAIENKLKE